MPNRRFNKQVANSRAAMMAGGRAKKKGGGNMISGTARKDEASGYYTPDMGMRGGAMMKKGGKVGKKKHCLLYTSPSPRDVEESRMPSSA